MGHAPPKNLFNRIFWYIAVYYAIGLFYIYQGFYYSKKWIKKKFAPKHRELNWLRKLAGIPPK